MLRLTTKVTVSPASSRAQLVGGRAHVLDRLRARLGEQRRQLLAGQPRPRRARAPTAGPTSSRANGERRFLTARAATRDEAPVAALDHVEHALGHPLLVDVLRVDAQALGQRDAVGGQALANLVGRGERVLRRDVISVGAQPAEVGRALADELRPPVGEVGRDLDADARQQTPGLAHEPAHLVDVDRGRPLGRVELGRRVQPRAPVVVGAPPPRCRPAPPRVAAMWDAFWRMTSWRWPCSAWTSASA